MIEAFKMVKVYESEVIPELTFSQRDSRGHNFKLFKSRSKTSVRDHYFTNRIVELWNRLPALVLEAKTVIQFEKRLDDHWKNANFKYNYRAPPPSAAHITRY